MKKINLLIFALVVLISVLAITIFMQQAPVQEEPVKQATKAPPKKPAKQAIVHYPVPVETKPVEPKAETAEEVAAAAPVQPEKRPPVELSDKGMEEALTTLKLEPPLFKLLVLENFIQRMVTTIDNLPEKQLPRAHLPLVPPKGRFITSGTIEAPQTSSRNQTRYNFHVQLLETLNQELVIDTYIYFYPLFQKAYEQLGYRNVYFNDRLVFVIDHLLETPNPAEPMLLTQPSVLYLYADPLLEKLSSGQKTLLRIGPDHRQKVMRILKEYRDRLVNLQP